MPRYTQPRKTWFYPVNFKIKAVELSLRDDVMSKDVAEALGIHSLKAQGVYVILKTKTTVYPLLTFLVRLVELIEPK